MSTVSPARKPRLPSTSRTPTVTATSATPSVAASSSTEPDRKRDAEGRHRLAAVALADLGDRRRLRAAAVERAQRRQAPHDVEEVRREELQRLPALPGALLRVAADQPHEDGDERQGDEHDRGRLEVERRDVRRARRPARRRRARPAAGSGRSSRRGRRRRRPRPSRSRLPRRRRAPQAASGAAAPRARAGAARGRSRRSAGPRPRTSHESAPRAANASCEQHQPACDGVQRRAVESTHDDPGDQRSLGEDEQRRRDADRDVDPEQRARRAGAAEQAAVEGAHPLEGRVVRHRGSRGRAAGPSRDGPPTRARKTWYVQPW